MANTPHLPDPSIPLDEAAETAEERAIVNARRRQAEGGEVQMVPHAEVMKKIAERKQREGG